MESLHYFWLKKAIALKYYLSWVLDFWAPFKFCSWGECFTYLTLVPALSARDGHVNFIQFLASIGSVALNTAVHVSWWTYVCTSVSIYLGVNFCRQIKKNLFIKKKLTVVMVTELCGYTECHWIVCFKSVNYVVNELYLNKPCFKNLRPKNSLGKSDLKCLVDFPTDHPPPTSCMNPVL